MRNETYCWPETVTEASRIQRELSHTVSISPLAKQPLTIGAVDAAYGGGKTLAAAVLFRLDPLEFLEEATAVRDTTFPYVPGYLSFREAPAILDALGLLSHPPDILLVDGQGIAHPRRFGLACHLGVLTGIPAIGCAKSRLIGTYEEPEREKGSWTPLLHHGDRIGAVLRTRAGIRPLFISPGHLVTLEDAIGIVLRCCTTWRLPEPIRRADRLAGEAKGQRLFPDQSGDS